MLANKPIKYRNTVPEPLISASNISVRRGPQQILQGVSLNVQRGEIVTVIGPNGAGKTTLVRTLLGLIKPQQGHITRAPALRIGYMPQKLFLDTPLPLSVAQYLALAHARRQPVMKVASEVGITALLQKPVAAISGGELQRVSLARALLREPQLLVLDEPVQGVDITGQGELYQLIENLRDQYQCGVLMVSHDLHVVMARTDTVICINQHVCCHGHPEDVSQHPAFQALFGDRTLTRTLAVYSHHHDHAHDLHGNVINSANHHEHDTHPHDGHAHSHKDHSHKGHAHD
jgi:zinc transport system ATP-binding protein